MKTFCSYYNSETCRSCDLIEINYAEQIKIKERKLSHFPLLPAVESSPWNFRNKVKLAVTGTIENPVIGLVGENNLDEGREILSCPLHHPNLNKTLPTLKEFIIKSKLAPYSIKSKKGELKGIILFHSIKTNETYLRFILRSKEAIDRIKKIIPELQAIHPYLKCITVNIQPIPHAILEGEEEIYLTEEKTISHQIGEYTFTISPRAFIQTNSKIAEELYLTAAEWINALSPKRFLELFSGQGNFSFLASKAFEKGLGIEINPSAVLTANQMAKSLGLDKLEFKASNAQNILEDAIHFSPDLLLVNPPRRGLGSGVELVRKIKASSFIYSSCNHETLLSDLKELEDLYDVVRAQIFDMFPQTSHFETLVELRLKESIHDL